MKVLSLLLPVNILVDEKFDTEEKNVESVVFSVSFPNFSIVIS